MPKKFVKVKATNSSFCFHGEKACNRAMAMRKRVSKHTFKLWSTVKKAFDLGLMKHLFN